MSIGNSGRIVIEIDPLFKQMLYAKLEEEGLTLKEWFLRNASQYVGQGPNLALFPVDLDISRDKK